MKNPYEVLGVTSSASMDEIKRAYRDKARRYSENQAKMDELNDAYDFIINNFGSNKANTSYADSGYGTGAAGGQTSEFGDIRAKLNSGRIDDAEMLLDGIPYQRRNAEWYYLKGTIQHRKGWLESALENFRKAKEMEPGNSEYEAAFNQLERESKGDFRRNRQNEDNDGCCSPCNICSSLMCADCCCECMGGDLIRCC
ncbi:MAG: molecular chaperone DnaJ [Ruminococcaceae bacterium]|nr:molecular chaperone DnaJ [Oscillospiraceae bacterium]